MKIKHLAVLLVLFAAMGGSAFAQGFRFDAQVSQQFLTTTIPGATNLLTVPTSAQIAICNFPANAVPCTNKATTFTSGTLGTPCSTSTQIVLTGTTTCVASPDAQENWGVWLGSGQYAYTITLPGGVNLGPYWLTLGIPTNAFSIANAGTFTNLAMNGGYLSANINSLNFLTEYQSDQTTANFATIGSAAGVATPANATVQGILALGGFVTSGCNSLSRTVCNTVAGYFHGKATGTGAAVWGLNPVVSDVGGSTGANLIGSEADVSIHGTPTYAVGYDAIICVQCGSDATVGTVPVSAHAFHASRTGAAQWRNGFVVDRASVFNGNGLVLDGVSGANPERSQWIQFTSYTGGGTPQVAHVFEDQTGGLEFDTASGKSYFLSNSGVGIQLPGSTSGSSTIAAVPLGGGAIALQAVAFASLGTPSSGSFAYCNDCTIANPCAGGGTGAFAKRLNGVWVCS